MRRGSSAAADEGTAAHHVLELSLRECSRPERQEGRVIRVLPDGGTTMLKKGARASSRHSDWRVDADMSGAVAQCWEHVVARLRALFEEAMEGLNDEQVLRRAQDRGWLRLERRVHFLPGFTYVDSDGREVEDGWGTSDIIIEAWPHLEVIDYKHGRGVVVEAKGNTQVKAYALGAHLETNRSFETVCGAIAQPRAWHDEGVIRDTGYMPASHLDEFHRFLVASAGEVQRAIERLKGVEDDASFYDWCGEFLRAEDADQGEKHCTFCDAKATCPAYKAVGERLAAQDFADEPVEMPVGIVDHNGVVGEVAVGSSVGFPNYVTLAEKAEVARTNFEAKRPENFQFPQPRTPEQWAHVLNWLPHIEAWAKSCWAAADAELQGGGRIPGWKLVEGKSNRRLKEDMTDADIEALVLEKGWLSKNDTDRLYTKREMLTGPQMEKAIPAKFRKEFSDATMYKPPGKVTMAPEADPKPAVDPQAASLQQARSDFEGVTA